MTTHHLNWLATLADDAQFNITPHHDNKTVREGYRLAVIRYKETKNADGSKKPAQPARSVELPIVAISVNPPELRVALQEAVNELQDNVVRSHLEQLAEGTISPQQQPHVTWSQINHAGISSWCEQNAATGKLSKEAIGAWFDAELEEPLGLAFIAAGITDETKMAAAIAAYRGTIVSLASPRASYPQDKAQQLIKAINKAAPSKTREQLLTKATAFLAPKASEQLLDL